MLHPSLSLFETRPAGFSAPRFARSRAPWVLAAALLALGFSLPAGAAPAEGADPPPVGAIGRQDLDRAANGRPRFDQGTLVAANGHRLRGVHWSLDNGSPRLPTAAEWAAADLPGRGLNTLHLYAEQESSVVSAGDNAALVDAMVSQTAKHGLYLVLTIGDTGGSQEFVQDFWSFYAPRYKDSAHVIYEIQNESWWCSPPASGPPRNLNRIGLTTIRAVAPDTPVLAFSYAYFDNSSGVLADVAWLQSQVSAAEWSNVGLAFHGYSGPAATQSTVAAVRSTIPVIETEASCLPYGVSNCPYPWLGIYTPLLEVHEASATSWLAFMPLNSLGDATFNQQIASAGLLWRAEAGAFPAASNPPLGQTFSLEAPANGSYVGYQADGRLMANFTSQAAATQLTLEAGPEGQVALKAFNGKYVQRSASNDLYANATAPRYFEWLDRPDGRVSLRATDNWRFVSADFNVSNPPPLRANRTTALGWESFEVAPIAPGPPTVTLTAPANGQVFPIPGTVTMTATAQHPQGVAIQRVDFHYGSSITTDGTAPYQASFSTSGQASGSTLPIFAVAYDANGLTATSQSVTVSFQANPPEIRVKKFDGTDIADGATFDFGAFDVASLPVSRGFSICNEGSSSLTVGNPASLVSGVGFTQIDTPPAGTVAPGACTTLRVRFHVAAAGIYTGALTIQNNDPNENPYDIVLRGTATSSQAPEIRVERSWDGVQIADGGSYDFGSRAVSTLPTSALFNLCNDGNAALVLANPTSLVSGVGFSQIGTAPTSPVAPGACTNFRVRFHVNGPGNYSGGVSIDNNDSNEGTFDFALAGTATN